MSTPSSSAIWSDRPRHPDLFSGEFGSGTSLADPAESAWLFTHTAQELTALLPSFRQLQEDHLTPEAAREAENQLIELAGTPCLDPEALIREVRHKMEEVGHLPGQPFTVGMLKHTEEFAAFLIHHTSRRDSMPTTTGTGWRSGPSVIWSRTTM
jgi:hypothetical protein